MRKDLIRISTAGMSREDWLAVRRGSLGGSDAAAILGLNPYSSPYKVWADKLGLLPEQLDNEAMRQGRDLEDYVARRFTEKTGKQVRRDTAILRNPEHPFAHANIDRRIVGEDAGLECKTTKTLNLKRFKNGNYPTEYYAQCMHYMAVTGAARWHLGVLVLGQDFLDFVIERDEEEVEILMAQEAAFWHLVEGKTPPSVDGSTSTSGALRTVYTGSQEGCVNLFGREGLLRQRIKLLEEQKALSTELRRIGQTLMLDLGEAEDGRCEGFRVSWRRQKRAILSPARLREVYPKLDLSRVMKMQQTRVLRIQEDFYAAD